MTCASQHLIPFVLITAPMFVLELLAFLWIRKLKTFHNGECSCAANWRLNFLYGYLAFVLIWTVTLNLYRFGSGCELNIVNLAKSRVYFTFVILLLVASIAFMVISLQYISMLKSKKCSCALKTNGDEILQAVVYIKIIAACLLGLILLMALFALVGLSKIK